MTKRPNTYLDYAAGTPIDPDVVRVVDEYQTQNFAHPSSLHANGKAAKTAREDARFRIAAMIGARSDECFFTTGATDGMTKAIYGTINAIREKGIAEQDMHIVMSVIEHAATRSCVEGFARRGIKTSIVGVTREGLIDIEQLKAALRPETVLVIVMLVNNEIGTIQPLREVRKTIDEYYTGQERNPVLLCDASQAPLSMGVNVQSIAADMLVIDAHKFYGPFMTGLLYVRHGVPYIGLSGAPGKPGEQGSPDIGAILGMTQALTLATQRAPQDAASWKALKTYCITRLQERFKEVRVNGILDMSVPNIVNVSFPNTDGEFLVARLDAAGVAVSAKSACLSGGGEGSYVVQAIDPERANNSIRISFGRDTTQDDIDVLVSTLSDVVK